MSCINHKILYVFFPARFHGDCALPSSLHISNNKKVKQIRPANDSPKVYR